MTTDPPSDPPPGDDETLAPSPCDDVLAAGATLLVAPTPVVLPSGTMSSAVTVTNCGDAPVDWTASTVPTVALAADGGSLDPGSSSELGFAIDASAHEPGAVEFEITVSETGHDHRVDVRAFREVLGGDLVGDLGVTAADDAGGCANQCITSALLSADAPSPDVTLEVETNTPAVINVNVSEQAPGEQDGHPAFPPGLSPVATSGGETTGLTTPVSPLAATTTYHIIVEATDANGNSSYQSGSFTTITPVEQPAVQHGGGGGEGQGCASQCITLARVTPQPDFHDTRIEVQTDEWAIIDVWVSTEVNGINQTPNFDGEPIATTDPLDVLQWDDTITGLWPTRSTTSSSRRPTSRGTARIARARSTPRRDRRSWPASTRSTSWGTATPAGTTAAS